MSFKIPAPHPNEEEDFEYMPIVRVGTNIPFGYMQDPNDEDILLPVAKELDLLNQAKRYLKQYSLRDVAAWLSEHSGRSISYRGLLYRVNIEKKRARETENKKYLISRLEKAIKKLERLEKSKLGAIRLRDCKTSED